MFEKLRVCDSFGEANFGSRLGCKGLASLLLESKSEKSGNKSVLDSFIASRRYEISGNKSEEPVVAVNGFGCRFVVTDN